MHLCGDSPVDGVDVEQLIGWILSLAPTYRWGGRRGIDRVRHGLEARALVGAYELALTAPGSRVFVESLDGAPAAATILEPKPMESDCFGVATAALSNVVCAPGQPERPVIVRRLLERARRDAERHGVELLILRVDSDDIETLAAAQQVGFAVCEATATWLADSDSTAHPLDLPPGFQAEVHEGTVAGVLSEQEVERLTAVTSRWDQNHFRADPRLPSDAVDRFYGEWVRNIASGSWSDCIFIVRSEGRLVGLASELTDRRLLDLTGAAVRAMEWLVVTEPGLAVGRALMRMAARHHFPGGRFHSWETQVRNLATIRRIEQTGIAVPVRSGYTLHAWPDGG